MCAASRVPRILALDCTTDWVSVAAADVSRLVERRERARQSHGERVLPLVDVVLAELGWSLRDLDAIAFGAGPGSFTGVRIACSVAQGLAFGVDRPLVPIGSLETLAEQAFQGRGAERVFACLDARMREVYVGAYVRESGRWREVVAPAVVRPADVAIPPGAWCGVGDGFGLYPTLAQSPALRLLDGEAKPLARAMLGVAGARVASGETVAADAALPIYVRHRVALTEAERRSGTVLSPG